MRRGGEPWVFYSWLMITIEWPMLILGAIGAVSLWRRNAMLAAFLLWDFFLSLAVYSWAGEKFAWLVLHPLLPVILLAGVGVQAIWQARGAWRAAGLAFAAVAAVYVFLSSWWVNHDRGADPREYLVSTQSSEQVKQVADQVQALAESRGPGQPPLTVTVDAAEGATFPYAWYFRHLSSGYIDYQQANAAAPNSDVLILTDASKARMEHGGPAQRLRRAPVRLPRLVGARVRPDPPRQPVQVHHHPQRLEPHGRDEGVALHQEVAAPRRHTVVPPSLNTRSPSWSHLAVPASP